MKYAVTVFFLFLNSLAHSQDADSSKTPYLMDKKIPFFKMMMTDSSLFYKSDLKKKTATVIVYFSPDCEHCKKFTETLTGQIGDFKKTQFIMISPLPMNKIKEFYEQYHIENYSSIKMGKDDLYFFGTYFQAHYIPFVAVYNKKGELVKGWDGGTTIKNLLEALK
ncbi:MAG: redoxin domain-containing protein [Sphingobacteriales bacterium]|nr:redoxin domain-containing protein [Sphingobacteriales bacterium]